MLDLNKYQEDATVTARDFSDMDVSQTKLALVNWALGLSGEAGEAAEIVKKYVFHGHELDLGAVRKELGDVLWYIANLAETVGLSLEEVASFNLEKLKNRYGDSFSEEKSKNRKEYRQV